MLLGKTYKKALSQMTTRIFLKEIYARSNKAGLQTALQALSGHIQYKLEKTNDRCEGLKKIHSEFSKLIN